MKIFFNEGNQIHNVIASSGSGTVIIYGSGSGFDFLTSFGSGSGSTTLDIETSHLSSVLQTPRKGLPGVV
jgi:hypothetical protein